MCMRIATKKYIECKLNSKLSDCYTYGKINLNQNDSVLKQNCLHMSNMTFKHLNIYRSQTANVNILR